MLDHKHIIKMHQAFLYKKDFILIMEYAGGGELRELVEERGRLTEVETQMYMKQICHAIYMCHGKGIIHCDLKLDNVLFHSH